MQNMTIEDLDKKIDQLEMRMIERTSKITLTMVGVIVSIWAVTLITASTLYIITRSAV